MGFFDDILQGAFGRIETASRAIGPGIAPANKGSFDVFDVVRRAAEEAARVRREREEAQRREAERQRRLAEAARRAAQAAARRAEADRRAREAAAKRKADALAARRADTNAQLNAEQLNRFAPKPKADTSAIDFRRPPGQEDMDLPGVREAMAAARAREADFREQAAKRTETGREAGALRTGGGANWVDEQFRLSEAMRGFLARAGEKGIKDAYEGAGFGRGVYNSYGDFRKELDKDPIAAIAKMPNITVIPGLNNPGVFANLTPELKAEIARRRGVPVEVLSLPQYDPRVKEAYQKENEFKFQFSRNYVGPSAEFTGDLARNLPVVGDVAGMLATGSVDPLESTSGAAATGFLKLAGSENANDIAERIDAEAANYYMDDRVSGREKAARAVESTAGTAAIVAPNTVGGASLLSRAARGAALNSTLDLPATYVALELRELPNDEKKKILATTAGVDLIASLAPVYGGPTLNAAWSGIGYIPPEATRALAVYGGLKAIGMDDKDAGAAAVTAAGLTAIKADRLPALWRALRLPVAEEAVTPDVPTPRPEMPVMRPPVPDEIDPVAAEILGLNRPEIETPLPTRPEGILNDVNQVARQEAAFRRMELSDMTDEAIARELFAVRDQLADATPSGRAPLMERESDLASELRRRGAMDEAGSVRADLAVGLTGGAAGATVGYFAPAESDEERLRNAAIGMGVGGAMGLMLARTMLRKGADVPEVAPVQPFMENASRQVDSAVATRGWKALADRIAGDAEAAGIRKELAGIMKIPTSIIELVDPATKYSREVVEGATGYANYMRGWFTERPGVEAKVRGALSPLIGESPARVATRTAMDLTPFGVGATVASQTDNDDARRAALIAGTLGSAALFHTDKSIVKYTGAFEKIKYAPDFDPSTLPPALRKGEMKLFDIIQHPESYALSPAQAKAVESLQKLLKDHFDGTNAARIDVGDAKVVEMEGNRLFQFFTRESVEQVLGKDHFPTKSTAPWWLRELPIEKERQLGRDLREALTNHPGLKLDGKVTDLIMRDLDYKAQLRAQTIPFLRLREAGFKDPLPAAEARLRALNNQLNRMTEEGYAAPAISRQQARVTRAVQAVEEAKAAREAAGVTPEWGKIPTVEGYLFPPDMLEQLSKLARDQDGFVGPLALLDKVTANVRTAMFSMDGSAWTMQGFMLAANDPVATVLMAPHLIAASTPVLGDKYAAWWFDRNRDLVRKWTSLGVVPGREHDEQHKVTKTADLPGIKQMETAGFGNFLPIYRISMAEHMSQTAMYLDSVLGLGLAAAAGDFALDEENEDWERIFAAGLSGVGVMSARLPYSMLDAVTRKKRADIDARIAKQVNRSSGAFNKQQYGITPGQSVLERTLLFRSPALVRNTFILGRLALTPGADGQIARAYLMKTALLAAGAMAALKYSMTGEMDSFDPTDPDSVFSPEGFARANLGQAGKFSVSNPIISLVRAALSKPQVEGAEGDEFAWYNNPDSKEAWTALIEGFADYFSYRLPDVAGKVGNLGREDSELQDFGRDIAGGDFQGAAQDVARMALPVSVQQVGEAGLLPEWMSWPFEQDPNINSEAERTLAYRAALLGMNWSPETISQELVREADANLREMFPEVSERIGDARAMRTSDLNAEGRDEYNRRYGADQRLRDLKALLEEENQGDAVSDYLDRSAAITDTHVKNMKRLDDAKARQEMTGVAFRTAVAKENERYRNERDSLEKDLGAVVVDRAVKDKKTGEIRHDMTVLEYLSNGDRPEDIAVSKYYEMYDKYTKPDGTPDFEKIEAAQAQFLATSPHAAYVRRRVKTYANKGMTDSEGNAVRLPELGRLEDVKGRAKPFWELRETTFDMFVEAGSPLFMLFGDYNGMREAVAQIVRDNPGLREDQVYYILRQSPDYKLYEQVVEFRERQMRGEDPTLDYGLVDYYNRAPVNPYGYVASSYGDSSLDSLGPTMAALPSSRRPNTREQLQFVAAYQGANPELVALARQRNRPKDVSYEFRRAFAQPD